MNDARLLLRIIKVPARYVTNVNFGANGVGTLYITAVYDAWKAPFPGGVFRWTK